MASRHFFQNYFSASNILHFTLFLCRKQSILTPGLHDPGTPKYTPRRMGL